MSVWRRLNFMFRRSPGRESGRFLKLNCEAKSHDVAVITFFAETEHLLNGGHLQPTCKDSLAAMMRPSMEKKHES